MQKSKIIIISGPSGSGKNTLIKRILEETDSFTFVPSFSTRAPRPGESQGNPYFFVSEEQFQKMVDQGDLIEYEQIHGNWYGTSFRAYQEAMKSGYVIKDIDVKGALNFKKRFGDQVTLIYLAPPSIEALLERLAERGESEEEKQVRLQRVQFEELQKKHFDYVVVNDELDKAVQQLKAIISKVCPRVVWK